VANSSIWSSCRATCSRSLTFWACKSSKVRLGSLKPYSALDSLGSAGLSGEIGDSGDVGDSGTGRLVSWTNCCPQAWPTGTGVVAAGDEGVSPSARENLGVSCSSCAAPWPCNSDATIPSEFLLPGLAWPRVGEEGCDP